ncbi:MAG: hypothetical protein L6R19_06405 [Alphaproteobacteria bacterium]|nr:hypothetical protein [Alphaproteobacteria bacterium]
MSREPSVALYLARQRAGGAAVGAAFGAALLLFDAGGLGALVAASADPLTLVIHLLGSAIAFAPAVICVPVGRLPAADDAGSALRPGRAPIAAAARSRSSSRDSETRS